MKKYLLMMSLIFFTIGLFGCQQSTGEQEQDGDSIINHEEIEEYDLSGTISKIDQERKSIRLQLSKKLKEHEEEIVITVSEDTEIYNEKKEVVTFEELTTGMKIKANLSGDVCLESDPRICGAGKIIIE